MARLRIERRISAASLNGEPTAVLHITPPDWTLHAVCVGDDPETFFPVRGAAVFSEPAIAICRTCPVRQVCLDHALEHDERYGVWGGATERERRRIQRQQRQETEPA